MLKHVQVSPHRNRSDSLSLRSSTSCASSLCGSPEPPIDSLRSSSRASSYCSLNETIPQVCPIQEYQRKLHPDDFPLRAQQQRIQRGEQCHFIVRKNPHYPPIVENKSTPLILDGTLTAVCDLVSDLRLNSSTTAITAPSTPKPDNDDTNNRRYISVYEKSASTTVCNMCRNNFRLCEFCQKNDGRILNFARLARIPTATDLSECTPDENDIIYKTSNCFSNTTYSPKKPKHIKQRQRFVIYI